MHGRAGGVTKKTPERDWLLAVSSFSGSFQEVSFSLMFASSEIFPCSTFFMAIVALTDLLIEPAWNNVSVVIGSFVSRSFTP